MQIKPKYMLLLDYSSAAEPQKAIMNQFQSYGVQMQHPCQELDYRP